MRSLAIQSLVFSILSLAIHSVTALPLSTPSSSILLDNALKAQKLNAEFETLNATDPCKAGEKACVAGTTATCIGGTWEMVPCPQDGDRLSCFALPSVLHEGTITACTTERTAAALIESFGAQGGVDGSGSTADPTNSSTTTNSGDSSTATETCTTDAADPTADPTADSTADPTTDITTSVTTTLTLLSTSDSAAPTITLDPVTQTFSASDAQTALQSLTSGGVVQSQAALFTITLDSTPDAAATPAPTVNGGLGDGPAAAVTITLETTPIDAAATAAPTSTSAAAQSATTDSGDSGDGGSGYGYGGY